MSKFLKQLISKVAGLEKKKTGTSRIAHIKQRNYCVILLRRTKKYHYANLGEKDVADNNKQFWRTVYQIK